MHKLTGESKMNYNRNEIILILLTGWGLAMVTLGTIFYLPLTIAGILATGVGFIGLRKEYYKQEEMKYV